MALLYGSMRENQEHLWILTDAWKFFRTVVCHHLSAAILAFIHDNGIITIQKLAFKGSLVAQPVKDPALSLWQLGSLLWCGFILAQELQYAAGVANNPPPPKKNLLQEVPHFRWPQEITCGILLHIISWASTLPNQKTILAPSS